MNVLTAKFLPASICLRTYISKLWASADLVYLIINWETFNKHFSQYSMAYSLNFWQEPLTSERTISVASINSEVSLLDFPAVFQRF